MNRKVLFRGKFLNVVELDGWYQATEPARSENNLAVAVLPYRLRNNGIEFLARFELNPAHLLNNSYLRAMDTEHQVSIITGACETGDPLYHVQQELHEEGGYFIDQKRFKRVAVVAPSKSSCTILWLYTVRITSRDRRFNDVYNISSHESKEFSEWVTRDVMLDAKDPYIHTIILKAGL